MSSSLVQKSIYHLTAIEAPYLQLTVPQVKRELFAFWNFCRLPFTKSCSAYFAGSPELNKYADCFAIKDRQRDRIVYGFRIFPPKAAELLDESKFEAEVWKALTSGFSVLQFPKLDPEIESNTALKNALYEMFFGAFANYCQKNKIKHVMTRVSNSTFANKILLRFGFVQKDAGEIMYLLETKPDAKFFAKTYSRLWNDRFDVCLKETKAAS